MNPCDVMLRRRHDGSAHALTLQPRAAIEGVTGTVRHLVTLSGSPFVCERFALSDDAHDQAPIGRGSGGA